MPYTTVALGGVAIFICSVVTARLGGPLDNWPRADKLLNRIDHRLV
jgi:hypothetical protein